ncbi:DUF4333 domain-containing protein [Nocardiopsis sp. NPDC058789]|uniref:DUF4333 domain-containing protein n=1 Tax=Nocardiopsis TaxID=2013 RepID=UPI00366D1D20
MRAGRSGIAVGTALGALLLATGCSFEWSIGNTEPVGGGDATEASDAGSGEETAGGDAAAVDVAEVERQSSERLAEQVGQAPDDFTCPGDLPAEEGAEMRCELTHGGQSLGVTLTVTSVDGGDVNWDVLVDE